MQIWFVGGPKENLKEKKDFLNENDSFQSKVDFSRQVSVCRKRLYLLQKRFITIFSLSVTLPSKLIIFRQIFVLLEKICVRNEAIKVYTANFYCCRENYFEEKNFMSYFFCFFCFIILLLYLHYELFVIFFASFSKNGWQWVWGGLTTQKSGKNLIF